MSQTRKWLLLIAVAVAATAVTTFVGCQERYTVAFVAFLAVVPTKVFLEAVFGLPISIGAFHAPAWDTRGRRIALYTAIGLGPVFAWAAIEHVRQCSAACAV